MSNIVVALAIQVGMVFSFLMSRSHLSSSFLYSWSSSVHSSISIGPGCPYFSMNFPPLVVVEGGCCIIHWLILVFLLNQIISSCISIDRFLTGVSSSLELDCLKALIMLILSVIGVSD